MKTWTELQEWVEVSAASHANIIANSLNSNVTIQLDREIERLFERVWFRELDDNERLAIRAAIRWKALEELQGQIEQRAEGWCEVYYRDLKRMYEEES